MAEQGNGLMAQIKKWVVNDYFTPNIQAEVILHTLLTPYIQQILRNECGIDAAFLTKKMSMEEVSAGGTPPKDDRGSKIDYIFVGEYLYLVELKTNFGSTEGKQAEHYIKCCCDADEGHTPRTFGEVFGDKLLRMLSKKYTGSWNLETLNASFSNIAGHAPEKTYAAQARETLKREGKASTYKYLYTIGQILDACPDVNDRKALWQKKLRLIYITPNGEKPHESLMNCGGFYIHPENLGSICLKTAVPLLKPEPGLEGYLLMLRSLTEEIYGSSMGPRLIIHRGSHQIGGCCTELSAGESRILIDLGADLPDTNASVSDDTLLSVVFDGRPIDGLLFTHPHGDHYGLYKKTPEGVRMYIGPLAKDLLKVLVSRLDFITKDRGLPAVERMGTYQDGQELQAFRDISVRPIGVDHSAPDAYMFYIQAAGKKILFTGDFREHGLFGGEDRFWRRLEERVPRGIDLLVTEGTMLSREQAVSTNTLQTEEQLGAKAEELFRRHKYNFVLVSSTNLDSVMEFYHHTPEGYCFVCDDYQAEILLTAMKARKDHPLYQPSAKHPVIHVPWKPWKGSTKHRQAAYMKKRCAQLREQAKQADVRLDFQVADARQMHANGFVMLARKNSVPERPNVFERMRDKFYPLDGQIIYSMWSGYLEERYADEALLRFIGGRPYETLHTSGHAYVETIAKLMETVDPKWVVPMHTQRAEEFSSIPAFARWKDRVRVLQDGEALPLDQL